MENRRPVHICLYIHFLISLTEAQQNGQTTFVQETVHFLNPLGEEDLGDAP